MNKRVFFCTLIGILIFFAIIGLAAMILINTSLSDICGTMELEGLEKPKGDIVNVLAVGVDESESRSDTMVLASMNLKDKQISLMSIPRDTRILYNGKYDKLTHLFSYDNSGQATLDEVKEITGAEINYMVVINFDGFSNVIDELGGIDIEVPDLGRGGMYYDDPYQDLHISLKAGYQHLNGEQAEGFVRFRSGYADADLGRIEAQRYFLQQLVKQKLKPMYLTRIPSVFKALEGDVRTNYNCSDILRQMIRLIGMEAENINSYSLPGEAKTASTRYGYLSCFIYDEEETKDIINTFFKKN